MPPRDHQNLNGVSVTKLAFIAKQLKWTVSAVPSPPPDYLNIQRTWEILTSERNTNFPSIGKNNFLSKKIPNCYFSLLSQSAMNQGPSGYRGLEITPAFVTGCQCATLNRPALINDSYPSHKVNMHLSPHSTSPHLSLSLSLRLQLHDRNERPEAEAKEGPAVSSCGVW